MVAIIPISRGLVTIVDEADAALVMAHRWSAFPVRQRAERYYAQTKIGGHTVRLHRMLLGAGPGVTVDHINGDGLDNRRVNIRIASIAQNNANRAAVNKSSFRGVTAYPHGRFKAAISERRGNTRCRHLGFFGSAEEAARAYDRAAAEKWGDYARLNFPHEAA